MAFTIAYVYKAIDSFSPVARSINSSVRKVSSSVGALGRKFKSLGFNFDRTRLGMVSGFNQMAAAGAAFFGGRELIRTATGFEDALADLSAITGAVGKDLEFFKNQALDLSFASVTAQNEVAGAMKIVASAKSELLKDQKGLVDVTKQVLLLKNASGIDLATAAKVATESLNQFGVGADQANRFVNVLAAGAKVGASEVADTGAAIIRAGSQALSSKVSFEELNAAIQVLAKGGEKGERAGTALRSMMNKMERAGKEMGVERIRPSVVGLAQAFENLTPIMKDPVAVSKILGEEYGSMGLILTRNAALVKQWTKEISGTNIAQEQADKRLATLRKRWEKMTIYLRTKVLQVFERIRPAISKVTDVLLNIGRAVSNFAKQNPKLTKFALIVAGVATAFGVLSLAVSATVGVLALITSPIALIIGGISGLIYLVSEFSGRWGELPGAVTDALSSVWSFITSTNPIDLLVDRFNSLKESVANFSIGDFLPSGIASVLGIDAGETSARVAEVNNGAKMPQQLSKGSLDVNINLRDRTGAVEKIQTKGSGVNKLNVGRNM